MDNQTFTIVDTETTGSKPGAHRVIEIGIIRVQRGEVVTRFQSFINPGCVIPEFISSLTGITSDDIKHAPFFEQVAEEILPLFEDSIFVAHNSNFDYKFLQYEFRSAGLAFTMDTLCTVRLSRVLFPQYKRHNLTALIERFSLACESRHRAFDDAKVVWDFLQMLEKIIPKDHLATAIARSVKKIAPARQRKIPPAAESEPVYVVEDFI